MELDNLLRSMVLEFGKKLIENNLDMWFTLQTIVRKEHIVCLKNSIRYQFDTPSQVRIFLEALSYFNFDYRITSEISPLENIFLVVIERNEI